MDFDRLEAPGVCSNFAGAQAILDSSDDELPAPLMVSVCGDMHTGVM